MVEKEFDNKNKMADEGGVILPSFRLGYTLTTPKSAAKLSFDEAILFGEVFEGKHSEDYFTPYCEEILKFLREYEPDVSLYKKGNQRPYVRYFQVPVINFPYFDFKYKDHRILVRESLTTCIGEAKSKIWFSATLMSNDDHSIDTYDYEVVEEVSRQLSRLGEKMLARFKQFYFRTINHLFGKEVVAEKDLEAKIFCLSTKKNIDENLKILLKKGKKEFLKKIKQAQRYSNDQLILNFLNWVGRRFDTSIEKLDLKFLTCFPRDDHNRSYGQRLSLVAQNQMESDKKSQLNKESYFTLGYEPKPIKTPLRYNNSEVSSRALVVEIGRVH